LLRITFAETILTLRGYNIKNAREWEKYRLVAYQVYTSIPTKQPKKGITQYLPLLTDRLNTKQYNPEQIKQRRALFIAKLEASKVAKN